MAFITEKKLAGTLDVPVALPLTELLQGDWLVVATIKVIEPMRLSYRYMNFQLTEATVDLDDIGSSNKISANLDLAFLGLYLDYVSGHPGLSGALDTVKVNALGVAQRSSPVIVATTPGVYSFIVANNMQSSSASSVPVTTSIDFKLCASGMVRLELDKN